MKRGPHSEEKNSRALTDLIILVILGLVVFLVSLSLDLFDGVIEFVQTHEHWQLDEWLTVIGVLLPFTFIYSLRRWREAHREAIQRQRAEHLLQRSNQRLEILHAIDLNILNTQSTQQVVSLILESIIIQVPLLGVGIAVFRQDIQEATTFVILKGDNASKIVEARFSLRDLSAQDMEPLRHGDIQTIEDGAALPPGIQALNVKGAKSFVRVPLNTDSGLVGCLTLATGSSEVLGPEYLPIIHEVADQLAIAIQQDQLREQIQRHTVDLEQRVADRTAGLQIAKERVEAILNNSIESILLLDPEFRIQQTNSAFNQLMACEPDAYFNVSLFDLIQNDDPLHQNTDAQCFFAEHIGSQIETQVLRKDGIVLDAEVGLGRMKETGFVCTIQDISARKAQERQLRYYASVQESIHDAVIAVDMDLHIRSWNQAAEEIYGWRTDEVLGKTMREVLQTHYESEEEQHILTALLQMGHWRGENVQHRKSGGAVYVLRSMTLLRDEHDTPLGIVSVNHDITDRKQAELELREAEQRYHALFEQAHDAVFILDMQGNHLEANHCAADMLGYSVKEIQNLSVRDLSAELPQSESVLERLLAGERIPMYERDFRRKDGSLVPTEINAEMVYDVEGKPLHIQSVVRDITERKQTENALRTKMELELEFQQYLQALHDITIELTPIDDLDEFYRRAVTLGLERFGIERLALFLRDAETGLAIGTYGTDELGNLSDEHHVRFMPSETGIMQQAFHRPERFAYEDSLPLLTASRPTGTGWNVAAVIRDGADSLGWLVADNGIHHKPATKPLLDILALYALTLGTQLAHTQVTVDLAESEERFRQIAENFDQVLFMRSGDNKDLLFVNQVVESMWGQPRDNFYESQTAFTDIVHPDDVDYVRQQLVSPQYMEQGLADFEYRITPPEGGIHWVRVRAFPIKNDAGVILRRAGVIEDITERKRSEETLREQHDFLQLVIDSVPDLIVVKDSEGRFQLVNKATAQIYDVAPAEMLGKTDAHVNLSPAEVDFFLKKDRETLESGQPIFIPEETVQGRFYQTAKIPLMSTDGYYDRLLVVASDITEHKIAEETLQQALEQEKELNELKSRFVSMASHEFRTPLATILAMTETLSAYRHKLNEEQIEMRFDKIKEQIGHLKNIMEDVLQLARIQAHRVEFNPVNLNLDDLIRSILDEFSSQPDVKHRLVYAPAERLHEFHLDRKLMRQIISNLVSNAIKYSADDQMVTITVDHAGDTLTMTVCDQGIGIPDADLKHLFEPFHRASNAEAIPGTGLGLIITKESVELHGGEIVVDSQVGVGTTFTIHIPLSIDGENDGDKRSNY